MKKFLFGIISLMLVGILISGCGGSDSKIDIVREGSMYMKPDVPIGKAFDQFFDKGSWKYFTSTDNEEIVEFNGSGEDSGIVVKFKIQFKLNGDEKFSLLYVGINGVAMDDEIGVALMETILSEYRP